MFSSANVPCLNTFSLQFVSDIKQCVSPGNYHRYNHGLGGSDVTRLPCQQLEHIYPMFYTLKS